MGNIVNCVHRRVCNVRRVIVDGVRHIVECTLDFVDYAFTRAWAWIRHNVYGFEQNVFQAGDPRVGDEICYRQRVVRGTSGPYVINHILRPERLISGISVLPLRRGLDSPETTIINGGINHNFVELRLIPSYRGNWGCDVRMYARR